MNTLQPTSLIASQLLRRPDFIGRNDTYAPRIKQESSLALAKKGESFFDVTGNLSEEFRDLSFARVMRYRQNWEFYEGRHFQNPIDQEGEEKLVLNYCDTIVDLGSDWLVGNGYKFTSDEGNEQVAELVNLVFGYNQANDLLWRLSQFGGVCGDAYLYVTVHQVDEDGVTALPREEWTVSVQVLNPSNVFPIWNPRQPKEMLSCLIQFPTQDADGNTRLFSMYITSTEFEVWLDDKSQGKKPNPFGCVNVVHIPHQPIARSVFGKGDIDVVAQTNQELNITAGTIRRVLKYHGEPTTVIFGASVSSLEKGSKKLWSNLPIDARVENLEIKSELQAALAWFKQLKRELAVKGQVPQFLLDSDQLRVSNTSGLAMQMTFQPIINKTSRRQLFYGEGLIKAAKLVILAHENILNDNVAELADNPDNIYNLLVEFTSLLPKDEQTEVDLATKRLSLGIWSTAEAIRRTSGVKNLRRLTLELAADGRAKLANTLETARATMMQTPVFSSVFLSSPFLSEDLQDVASAADSSVGSGDQSSA